MTTKDMSSQVRFTPELRSRLDRIAARSGLHASELIRRAVDAYLREAEKNGALSIPLDNSIATYSSDHDASAGYRMNEADSTRRGRKRE